MNIKRLIDETCKITPLNLTIVKTKRMNKRKSSQKFNIIQMRVDYTNDIEN